MKKYVKPYMEIEEFECDDIITASNSVPEEENHDVSANMSSQAVSDFGTKPSSAAAGTETAHTISAEEGRTEHSSEDDVARTFSSPSHDAVSTGVDYFFNP